MSQRPYHRLLVSIPHHLPTHNRVPRPVGDLRPFVWRIVDIVVQVGIRNVKRRLALGRVPDCQVGIGAW